MGTPINFPKSGMGINEGVVLRWLKHVGEAVAQGEIVVEIETAKATQEVEAPAGGRLAAILVGEGQSAAVNTTLGIIEALG
jgi:pyruvate/2-oxoglutarate dehydrogenase complex dihydrolipoamide acyltransferase (E2) component